MLSGVARLAGEAAAPLTLRLEPTKRIFSSREGVTVKFVLTARARTKVCLSKDVLSQMQISVGQSGRGQMPLAPLVLKDNTIRFQQALKVRWLEPGESLTLRANIKRLRFADGQPWAPGEYSVGATFNLCEQTPTEYVTETGQEIPVRAESQGWFMIMS